MEIFIAQALTFLGLEMILLGALIVYAFYKANWSKEQFMKNWVHAEGGKTSVWKGVSVILIVPIILAGILYAGNSNAADTTYFDSATVFVGIDNTLRPSPFCKGGGINNRLSSNIGFVQNMITDDVMNIGLKYTHHSCALNPDDNAYDSLGIVIEWKIW